MAARRRSAGQDSVHSRAKLPDRRWSRASLGVDLGGTKVALGVVAADGAVLAARRILTHARRPASRVIDDLVACASSGWADALPASQPVGVGVAGQIGPAGEVRFGPNLRWHDVPLADRLARGLGRSVSVLNDVQAATYGEWRFGAGRGVDDVVGVFVGTGVGGGVVAGGRLLRGSSGTAGELGHLTVEHGGRRCRCRNRGCLEAYVGGWAIAERAREAIAAEPAAGRELARRAGSAGRVTAATVEQGFRARDPLSRRLVAETMDYLACGLVSVVNGFNPEVVVLGGGVMEGFGELLPDIARSVRERALEAATRRLKIVPAQLGGESGLIGAACFALGAGRG